MTREDLSELRRFRILYDLATALTGDHAMEENLQLLVDMSRELLGAHMSYLALAEPGNGTLKVTTCAGAKTSLWERVRVSAEDCDALLPGPGWEAAPGKEAASDPGGTNAREFLASEGLVTGVRVPVEVHDKVLGHLFAANRLEDPFTPEGRDTLVLIGNLVAVEISRKRAEQALEESAERLRAVFENATDAIFIKDRDRRYQMANAATGNFLGVSHLEVPNRTDEELLDPEMALRTRQVEERVLSGEAVTEEFTRRREGETAYYHVVRTPLRDQVGRVTGLCGVARELTALKRLEARTRQASKMEAIGTFSAGIAHDFNNILGIITVNLGMATREVADGTPARKNLDLIKEACARGRDLVNQIVRFSAGVEEEKRPLSLGPLLDESIKLLRSSAPGSVQIRTEIGTARDRVLGDPSQLHQVFINLGTNALYAMRETGGTLTVTLEEAQIKGRESAYSPCLDSGPHIRISFADTGPGMPEEVLERAFDPYFSTKPKGEGNGMGLSVARGIIKGHGGSIEVRNRAGGGCLFEVLLPCLAQEGERPPKGTRRAETANACVLLVDDEPGILTGVGDMLKRLGYRVVPEADPRNALQTFTRHAEDFDLVITDMTMPGITGADLAREVKRIRPEVPVLLCTGYNEKIAGKTHEELGIRGLLMKPFAVEELDRKIRTVLGGDAF